VQWAETAAQKLHDGLRRADPTWRDLHWIGYFVSCARSAGVDVNQMWSQYPLEVVAVAGNIVTYLERAVWPHPTRAVPTPPSGVQIPALVSPLTEQRSHAATTHGGAECQSYRSSQSASR
jgi:hypothetical protein